MGAGRKPKPTAMKELEGNPGKRKLNKKEPMPGKGMEVLEKYVDFYNKHRPCYALGYDTPVNYRKRFFKGELERKNTFENRVLSEEPKFVQKRRKQAQSEDVSTFLDCYRLHYIAKGRNLRDLYSAHRPTIIPARNCACTKD